MTSEEGQARDSGDRYAAQRRAGFPWLRFEEALEREYRASFADLHARRIRVGSVAALAAILGFILVDQVFGFNLEPAYADLLLVGISLPAIGLPLLATFHPRGRAHLHTLILLGNLGVAAAVLVAVVIGRGLHDWFPYEALLLVTAFIYFVSGLMFYPAMLGGLLLLLVFMITNWTLQQPLVLRYEAYFLLVANGLGGVGLYLIERQSRVSFLMRGELEQQSLLDSLTGLMNHRAFNAHLEKAWGQARRGKGAIGLILFELDDFRGINERRGRAFGDQVLRHVADTLRACTLRPLDAAGRYGASEFIGLWYDVDGGWFGRLARDLPERLRAMPGGTPKAPIQVTASGGAVLAWPARGLELAEVLKVAENLLHRTQSGQPGTVAFRVLNAPAAAGA